MTADWSVHVRNPYEDRPTDESWLGEVVKRHGGELPEFVFATDPLQRYPTFSDEAAADQFVTELIATGRWMAHRPGGCSICSPAGR